MTYSRRTHLRVALALVILASCLFAASEGQNFKDGRIGAQRRRGRNQARTREREIQRGGGNFREVERPGQPGVYLISYTLVVDFKEVIWPLAFHPKNI